MRNIRNTNPECDSGSDSEMEPPKDPKKKKKIEV